MFFYDYNTYIFENMVSGNEIKMIEGVLDKILTT